MISRAGIFVAIGYLAAFGTAADARDLLTDYTLLTVPRSTLPIGARWIPNVGPSGSGATNNVTIARGSDSTRIDATTRRNLSLSLANLLGLGASSLDHTDVELSGVEIYRVDDLTKLNIRPGEQVLYEGIKAKSIKLRLNQVAADQVSANAAVHKIPVSLGGSSGSERAVTIDGSDLFIAYKVVEIGAPKMAEAKVYHQGEPVIVAGAYRFQFCRCLPDDGVRVTVANILTPRPDGSFEQAHYTLKEGPNNWIEVPLPARSEGAKWTAASATVRYNGLHPMPGVTKDGQPVAMRYFTKKENVITLRTVTSQIKSVSRPSGTL
ncbi:hypothetical protein [Sphingomonas sp.]|uniref:hypothetical protein n=1 Tax=Sphingomonas sp. TaxID=28214 RepID=UPI003B3AAA29